jgi:hypothetical protein
MNLNQIIKSNFQESQKEQFLLFIDDNPVSKYQSLGDATRDLHMLQAKFPEKNIKLKTEKCVTQAVNSIPEETKPRLIKLHYFTVDDAEAAQQLGMKQDRNGRWYLPQYSTSGAGFDKKYSTCRRTFGEVEKTIRINENKKNHDQKQHDHKQKPFEKDTSDEIADPEVRSVRQFAKSHYLGAKSEQEAFDKFVIHSLRHSEQDDTEQHRKLKIQAQQIQDLQDQLHALKKPNTNSRSEPDIQRVVNKYKPELNTEKQIPVSEQIAMAMQDCIKTLMEKRSKIHKNNRRTMPATRNYPDMNSFYELYRFGIAMGTQPDEDSPSYGPVGSHPSTYAYSDGDSKKIKAAEKNMGKKGVFLSKGCNSEADDVFCVSPVPSKKSRKYK